MEQETKKDFRYADEERWDSDYIYNSTNGHFYAIVWQNTDWDIVRTKAKAMYCEPLETYGYLVTITSSSEQIFLQRMMSQYGSGMQYWSGGYYDGSDWRWADGPEAGQVYWHGTGRGSSVGAYYAWSAIQPDGNSGAMQIWTEDTGDWTWDDVEKTYSRCDAFIVEWGDDDSLGIQRRILDQIVI